MNTSNAMKAYKKQNELSLITKLYRSNKKITLQERILLFNKNLNNYNYGLIIDGKPYIGYDLDFSKYKTISPEDFVKYQTGVCWDYVEYEAYYFTNELEMRLTKYKLKEDKSYSMYYMQHIDQDGDMPTHTWLGYKLDSKIYSFESSWRSIQGVKEHKTEKDMVKYYLQEQVKYQESNNNPLGNYVVLKYSQMPKYNLTPEEYMNIILDKGFVIESTIKSCPVTVKI